MDIPEFAGCTAFRTYNNSMERLIKSGDILFGTLNRGRINTKTITIFRAGIHRLLKD